MCRGLGVGEPIIAYQKKAGFLSNFLQLSYEPDPSEEFAGRIFLPWRRSVSSAWRRQLFYFQGLVCRGIRLCPEHVRVRANVHHAYHEFPRCFGCAKGFPNWTP